MNWNHVYIDPFPWQKQQVDMSRQWYILTMRFALSACVVILQDIVDRHVDHYSPFVLKMDQCRWDVYPEKWGAGAFMRASRATIISTTYLPRYWLHCPSRVYSSGDPVGSNFAVKIQCTDTWLQQRCSQDQWLSNSAKSLQNSFRRFGRITGKILMELSFLGVGIWRPLLASNRDCCNLH